MSSPQPSTSKDDDPSSRLPSIKPPRDLTLGAGKTNKKLFIPNLNVARNKNKQQPAEVKSADKSDKKWKRIKTPKPSNKPTSNIVKSSGIFSEGFGSAGKSSSSRPSYGRDSESVSKANIAKPFIKVKEVWKIDKELEDEKLKKFLGDNDLDEDNEEVEQKLYESDAPIQLPITERKPIRVVSHQDTARPETFESVDIINLLESETPRMVLVQLPESLPGQGMDDDRPPRPKPGEKVEEIPEQKKSDTCALSDMTEGKIGKILVYKSGKVKMQLGDTLFDLNLGTQPCFLQEAMSIAVNDDDKTACMINMGQIENKLNVVPDWETLFKDIEI